MNLYKKIFSAFNKSLPIVKKHYSDSALYITGIKASENFAVLTPFLDFEERIAKKEELEKNLELRQVHVNLPATENRWEFFKEIDNRKAVLEFTRDEIARKIREIVKSDAKTEQDEKDLAALKLQGKTLKDEIHVLKDFLYGLEESVAEKVLSIPNVLHEKTPHFEAKVLSTFGVKPGCKSEHHLEIAKRKNLVEYQDEKTCYLLGEAALFELATTFYVDEEFQKANFQKFSNSDFTRSVVAEGCGTNWKDPSVIFTLKDTDDAHTHELSKLHFTGGASLYSFMAYHTKLSVFPSLLPVKYVASGRKYKPDSNLAQQPSLRNLAQTTASEIFVATSSEESSMNEEFEEVLRNLTQAYEKLGYHFRVVLLPAKELENYESLRASLQMYSCHSESYLEVASLSICDDYLSKRLLFTYGSGSANDRKFPKVICGTVLNVQKLLGCVLEYNDASKKDDLLTDSLRKFVGN